MQATHVAFLHQQGGVSSRFGFDIYWLLNNRLLIIYIAVFFI